MSLILKFTDNSGTKQIDEVQYNNTTVIRSVDSDQHRILNNIIKLYCPDIKYDDICDPTYSIGNFYGSFKVSNSVTGEKDTIVIPDPKYKYDVYPQVDGVEKIEPLTKWPLEDNSVRLVIVDLPFVISPHNCASAKNPKDGSLITYKRFSGFYPVQELFETYYFFIKESYRVLKDDGFLVFKCQNTVSGGKQLNTPELSWFYGESVGFDMVDKFILTASSRILSSKHKDQKHSRRFESCFLVFNKSQKKKSKYLTFDCEDKMREIIEGFFENNFLDIPKYVPK